MNYSNALNRRIQNVRIDVHPTEQALLISYDVEARFLPSNDSPVFTGSKECQRTIKITNLSSKSDVKRIARDVISSCKCIDSSKIAELEYLIRFLRDRKPQSISVLPPKYSTKQELTDPGAFDSGKINETASVSELDEYLELLYEDTSDQLRASALILQLARRPDCIGEIYKNEILVGALARVLQENWKKHIDLSTNLVYIFFCFSSFSNFHDLIVHFKLDSLCMDILEEEVRNLSAVVTESEMQKHDQLLRVTIYLLLNISESMELQEEMFRRSIAALLCRVLQRKNKDLLLLVLSFLRKLSLFRENVNQIINANVMDTLMDLLTHESSEVILLTLRLIYNLAFDADLRTALMRLGAPKLFNSLLGDTERRGVVLRILYLLSTEDKNRAAIAASGCLSTLMRQVLVNDPADGGRGGSETLSVCLSLLTNLACDPGAARSLGEPRGIRMLFRRAFGTHNPLLMRFLRNLASFEEIRPHFVEFLPDLVGAVLRLDAGASEDEISVSVDGTPDDPYHSLDAYSFDLECLGVLATLSLAELDYTRILTELDLRRWLEEMLTSDSVRTQKPSLFLETLRLISTICADSEAAKLLSSDQGPVVSSLVDILADERQDERLVFQALKICYRFLSHEKTRNLIRYPGFCENILRKADNENRLIRNIVNAALDIIAEHDDQWRQVIRSGRFMSHNADWLHAMQDERPRQQTEVGDYDDDNDECGSSDSSTQDLSEHEFLLASNLLHDAAGWFAT